MFCGTPNYMAPELIKKEEYDGFATDIWACGVVLFMMINGQFPFWGQNDSELFKWICAGNYLFKLGVSDEA